MTTGTKIPTSGFIGYIPVRNIWLLLLYASQLYRELPASRRVELEDAPDHIPHLVAEILANAVERRLRRYLSNGYQRRRADLRLSDTASLDWYTQPLDVSVPHVGRLNQGKWHSLATTSAVLTTLRTPSAPCVGLRTSSSTA